MQSSTSTFFAAETLIQEDDDDNSSLDNHCSHSSGSDGSDDSHPEVSEDDELDAIAEFIPTSKMAEKMALEVSISRLPGISRDLRVSFRDLLGRQLPQKTACSIKPLPAACHCRPRSQAEKILM
jgi:hypothetical protein